MIDFLIKNSLCLSFRRGRKGLTARLRRLAQLAALWRHQKKYAFFKIKVSIKDILARMISGINVFCQYPY